MSIIGEIITWRGEYHSEDTKSIVLDKFVGLAPKTRIGDANPPRYGTSLELYMRMPVTQYLVRQIGGDREGKLHRILPQWIKEVGSEDEPLITDNDDSSNSQQ